MILSAGNITENSVREVYGSRGGFCARVLRAAYCDAWHFRKIRYLFSNIFLTQLKMYVQSFGDLARSALDLLFTSINVSGKREPIVGRYRDDGGTFRFAFVQNGAVRKRKEHTYMMRVKAHTTMRDERFDVLGVRFSAAEVRC